MGQTRSGGGGSDGAGGGGGGATKEVREMEEWGGWREGTKGGESRVKERAAAEERRGDTGAGDE